jgi:hypothetical protein
MFKHYRLPRLGAASAFKRAGPIAAAIAVFLILVPTAASGNYTDASGDAFGDAGDITAVTVAGDKASGQVVFRITGTNIASSEENTLMLDIDSDANPLTGDMTSNGADYSFEVDDDTYGFGRWDGAHWVRAPNNTVRVSGGTTEIMISVNRSELGNSADFNFQASTFALKIVGNVALVGMDLAPDDGLFNYSFDTNGPQINSVDVQTTPSNGPRAGKRFTVTPTALKLPPDGRTTPTAVMPDSYTCKTKLGARTLAGTGTGGCTVSIPKKARGKKLTVELTVNYQGATKTVPLTFKVA